MRTEERRSEHENEHKNQNFSFGQGQSQVEIRSQTQNSKLKKSNWQEFLSPIVSIETGIDHENHLFVVSSQNLLLRVQQ